MNNFTKLSLLFAFVIVGSIIFQAQDNNSTREVTEPLTDRPTEESMQFTRQQLFTQPLTVTDAGGYDNFDIGTNGAEMNMTENPNNPLQFFFGVNSSPVNQWYSNDALNWEQTSSISLPGGTCCDPWTAYDSLGNLYYSVLGSSNFVAKSVNNGQTFGPFVSAVAGTDRNTIAVDYTNGPYKGYIYAAAWSPNANFGRSTDGGASWTTTLANTPNTTPGNMICIG